MKIVILTGMSGAGKSVALSALEDFGLYCVDNLPANLIVQLIDTLVPNVQTQSIAIGVDVRTGESVECLPTVIQQLIVAGHRVHTVFLNASDTTILQRFSETRRRHPLNQLPTARGTTMTLEECIEYERELLGEIQHVSHVIDTTALLPDQLRWWIRDLITVQHSRLTLIFESFGYKTGIPLDADLVFDVRCLPNPHYDSVLRPLTGQDAPVQHFLKQSDLVTQMITHIEQFVMTWLPHYATASRSYLTVGIGCTGGQHRSVYCVEQLATSFRISAATNELIDQVLVRHRRLIPQRIST
jgi:UPF0042 nucleotide-binding protein